MNMVKIRWMPLLLVLLALSGKAQESPAPYTFLLKGKVKNSTERSFDITLSTFLQFVRIDVPLNKDGTFSQEVHVEGMQNMHLPINEKNIGLYVQPGDTISLTWDAKNVENTVSVQSPNKNRNYDLQLNLLLGQELESDYDLLMKIEEELRKNTTRRPRVVFGWSEELAVQEYDKTQKIINDKIMSLINNSYNQKVKFVYRYMKETGSFFGLEKFMNEVYYNHIALLKRFDLLENNLLSFGAGGYTEMELFSMHVPLPRAFQNLSEDIFYMSPAYRDFLINYISLKPETILIRQYSTIGVGSDKNGNPIQFPHTQTRFYSSASKPMKTANSEPYSSIKNAYKNGQSEITLPSIMDWYVTQLVLLNQDSYENTEAVVNDYLPKCSIKAYRDTLMDIMANRKRFAVGQPAPGFTLQNLEGKTVSLSDFKGKVVLLDFWGVHCGPCISDFKNIVPQLHKKYQGKDVVFVNICVNGSKTRWKEIIKQTKLDGVNLIAEGWTNHPICKAYNVNAVPHYILIDKEGKFVEYKIENIYNLYNKDQIEKLLSIK